MVCCLRATELEDDVFMTRSVNITPKTTEQNFIVRSGKSGLGFVFVVLQDVGTGETRCSAARWTNLGLHLAEWLRSLETQVDQAKAP